MIHVFHLSCDTLRSLCHLIHGVPCVMSYRVFLVLCILLSSMCHAFY